MCRSLACVMCSSSATARPSAAAGASRPAAGLANKLLNTKCLADMPRPAKWKGALLQHLHYGWTSPPLGTVSSILTTFSRFFVSFDDDPQKSSSLTRLRPVWKQLFLGQINKNTFPDEHCQIWRACGHSQTLFEKIVPERGGDLRH